MIHRLFSRNEFFDWAIVNHRRIDPTKINRVLEIVNQKERQLSMEELSEIETYILNYDPQTNEKI